MAPAFDATSRQSQKASFYVVCGGALSLSKEADVFYEAEVVSFEKVASFRIDVLADALEEPLVFEVSSSLVLHF
jgi:hypothetical protein